MGIEVLRHSVLGTEAEHLAEHPFWQRATLVFLLVTTVLRLKLLTVMELVPDEAYYWDWSRHLAWGYYDQGPMIAYVIRFTTWLFGATEFGVRFGVCMASLVALYCGYMLARRLYSPLVGFITVLTLGVTPLMAVGSEIATYDPLLVCFWAIALVCLERALFGPDEREQRRAWFLTGIAIGLGFLSKHTMLLIMPCVALFLLLSPAHRHWLRCPQPYLGLGISLLLYSGVFWWNAHHHWWTFGHLLYLTKKTSGNPLRRLGDFVGSQALLLGPGLFLACLAAMRRTFRRPTSAQLFLLCMGLPILLFFCAMACKAKVQANWAPCAWITPTILWAAWIAEAGAGERLKQGGRNKRRQEEGNEPSSTQTSEHQNTKNPIRRSLVSLGTVLTLSVFLTVALLAPGVRMALGVRLPPEQDVSNTAYGWRGLAAHVQSMREEMKRATGRSPFIAGNGYQYTALMAFYLPDHPETHDLFLHFRLTMYAAYVENLKQHLGEDCVFINAGEVDDSDLRSIFTSVQWQTPYKIWRRPLYRTPITTIHIAKCYRYRRYVGLAWASGG